MPAYVIANIEASDPEAFKEYVAGAPATVAAHGGTYIVRTASVDAVEGDWKPARIAVIRFDSVEKAKGWYESPEYKALRAVRAKCATAKILLVEGTGA
jgi:uncharacterized protein (DUF1330 family)